MVNTMGRLADACWRAAAYCLHPRVIGLSLLPLLLAAGLSVALAYFFWEPAVDAVRSTLESWALVESLLRWLASMGAEGFRSVMAPLLVIVMALPLVMVLSLVLVALLMTPSIVALVAERRFPGLERKIGARWWQGLAWSLLCSAGALGALFLSMPFWLVPPLVLVLPPLIWGWLSYRVFTFDVLADHASPEERRQLMKAHRLPLLSMGVITGYLGAAPAMIWAFGVLTVVFAPVLVVATVWLYTLVFAFSTLWFAHYALAALAAQRAAAAAQPGPVVEVVPAQPVLPAEPPAAAPPLLP
ncbi:MAG: EI24 domain-containing protein [Roseateles asaccharophilus]|uniref:Etoposide-induced protein 2.4 (EI24) n=1 Tax=Roseateles asaccharophilus TaxID=582607 RepID=A0A4R6N7G9_9BURK|nr:EI24 domain-containing protein [Roseateles asaccharophilus]MDN3546137.1 EI24 domain-containing protein [Roseateles asaccharophilus]TDP11132.1 etoposide-induced protein 2.4 (EI24) [Roseateles asaccharophilus]